MNNSDADITDDITVTATAPLQVTSPSTPALTYDYDAIMKAKAASPTSEIPRADIKRLQDFRVKEGLQKTKLSPSRLIDPTVRVKALKLAHISN